MRKLILAIAVIAAVLIIVTSCVREKPLGNNLMKFSMIKNGRVYYGVRDTVSGDTVLRPLYKAILHDENFIWAIKNDIEVYNLSDCSLFGKFQKFTRYKDISDYYADTNSGYYVGTFPAKKEKCYYFPKTGRREEIDPDNVLETLSHFVIMSDSTWELLNYWGVTLRTMQPPITIITNNDGIYAYAYKDGSSIVLKELQSAKNKRFSRKGWDEYKRTTNLFDIRHGCEIRQSRHKLD